MCLSSICVVGIQRVHLQETESVWKSLRLRLQLVQVQAIIGAKKALAFDLTAACSGFVVGLVTGAQFIRTGIYRNVLVIGADALSRYVDWRDRGRLIPVVLS